MWETTAAQDKILSLPHRSVHMRVSVDPGSGFVNLSSLEGYDWVVGASWGETVDSAMPDASVRIRHRMESFSMSLLMASSKLNAGGVLLTPGNDIKIETATVAEGMQPVDGDYIDAFIGEIDAVDMKKDPIELRCRAEAAELADTFIENWRVYPHFAGVDEEMQEVAQAIIDDNITSGPTLYLATGTAGTPRPTGGVDDPSFKLFQYKQQRQPVLSALRALAGVIGWDVRYRYLSDTGQRELQLYEPGRDLSAIGTLSLTGQPSAAETFAVDGVTLTAVASSPAANQFAIGSTVEETARNIADAVNGGTAGTDVIASRTIDDDVRLMARDAGAPGNAITLTESLSNATVDGAGFLGGTRLGRDVNITPDYTFAPSQYYDIAELALNRSRVRNAIEVVVGVLQSDRDTISVSDAASITQFGRRFAGIAEDGSSQVDTVTEGLRMAQALLSDLKDPEATHAITAPYFWPVELGDVHTYQANGYHYDSDQTLAVVAYRHSVSGNSSRTTIVTRGRPSAGIDRWLVMEGRPGVAPGTDLFIDDALGGAVFEPFMGGFRVAYDDPRTRTPPMNDWAYSELHVGSSAAFTPTAATFVQSGRTTRFEVSDLTPGQTYYAKVFAFDSSGNKTLVSSEVVVATQQVGPYHENLDGQQDQLLRNNDFNIYTLGTSAPPDKWEMVTGTYAAGGGADTCFVNTGNNETGDLSLDFNYSATGDSPDIRSVAVPFKGGDILRASVVAKILSGANSDPDVRLRVRWLDDAKAQISISDTSFSVTSSYQRFSTAVLVAPATTRYVQLSIAADSPTDGSTAFVLNVDKAGLLRAKAHAKGSNLGLSGGAGSTYTDYPSFTLREEKGLTYSVVSTVARFTVDIPGRFTIRTGASYIDDAVGATAFELQMRILVNGVSVFESHAVQAIEQDSSSGDFQADLTMFAYEELEEGDYIEMQVKHIGANTDPNGFATIDIQQVERDD